MSEDSPTPEPASAAFKAWQPLTPAGVGRFAGTGIGRLWLVQALVALTTAALVVWFVHRQWFPVVARAIETLPAAGVIRGGELDWPGPSPVLLAENAFLAITVDTNRSGQLRSPAHVQVEFEPRRVVARSLYGYAFGFYPRHQALAFNRPELSPWWGAWWLPILVGLAAGVMLWLGCCWVALATLYAVPAWLMALYTNRVLSPWGSWKLCGAALLPAALFLDVAGLVYGLGGIDLVRLAIAFAAHFLVGWLYMAGAVLAQPRHPGAAARRNPFARG